MSSNYRRKSIEQLNTAKDRIAAGSNVRATAKFVGVHVATKI